MFPAIAVIIGIILMIFGPLTGALLGEKYGKGVENASLTLGIVAGIYCILAGLSLAGGWVDPFASADPVALGRQTGRRGGLIVVIMRYWPYALMLGSGYVVYLLGGILRMNRPSSEKARLDTYLDTFGQKAFEATEHLAHDPTKRMATMGEAISVALDSLAEKNPELVERLKARAIERETKTLA